MKKKKILSLLIALCVVLPIWSQLTLTDCVKKALESNYSIKIAVNNESVNRNNANYSQFLPSLAVNGAQKESNIDLKRKDANGNQTDFNGVITQNLSANINLNWRIFDGLAMFTTYAKQKEFIAVGELKTQLAVETLVARVHTGYYNVLVQQSLMQAAQYTFQISAQRYHVAEQKHTLGKISGLELKQARIDLNADSSRLIQQDEVLKRAYIDLNTLINGDLEASGYVKDSILLLPQMSKDDIERMMLTNNTALLLARKEIRMSELDLKAVRAALFPALDFSSGYNISQAESPASLTTYTRSGGFFYGFTVSMSIFDRLENIRKIKNAQVAIKNQDLMYQDAELQTRSDLVQLYNSYEKNLQMVRFENESMQVAQETLEAAMERYRLGNLSGIEFREFQRSYLDTASRKIAAEFQAKSAEISLLLLSGSLKI